MPKSSGRPRKVGNDGALFKCPICRAILPGTDLATFPFCSERCRTIDLGNWLDGRYSVSRPIDPADEPEDQPRARPPRLGTETDRPN